MDEYQLEIQGLRRQLSQLREAEADPGVIGEYEAEVDNLSALYRAASETFAAGEGDSRVREALALLGFGEWSLRNVYGFVYDLAMELPLQQGRELAAVIDDTDFTGSLLESLEPDY